MKQFTKRLPFGGLWEPTLLVGKREEWFSLLSKLEDFFHEGYETLTGGEKAPPHFWHWLLSQVKRHLHLQLPFPKGEVVRDQAPKSGEVLILFTADREGNTEAYLVYWPHELRLSLHLLLERHPHGDWQAWIAWRAPGPWVKEVLPFFSPSPVPAPSAYPRGLFPWGYRALGRDGFIWDLAGQTFAQWNERIGLSFPPDTLGFHPLGFGVHLFAQRADDPPYRAFVWLEEEGVFLPVEEFLGPFRPYEVAVGIPRNPEEVLVALHELEPDFFEMWKEIGLGGRSDFASLTDFRRVAAFLMGRETPPPMTPEEVLFSEGLPVPEDLVGAAPFLPGVVVVSRELPWGRRPFILGRGEGGRVFSLLLDSDFRYLAGEREEGVSRSSWEDLVRELSEHVGLHRLHFYRVQSVPTIRKRLEELATQVHV